ncbi:hypothetical protein Nepgr_008780 [Nepenthes gracilis]|uniref:SAP30-binding protein n=1 Tax=Nepenthes gracilis TaxID=150966 RepID=A0AAD3S9Q4_NEPGR|nr:hypothetical protein Nepgr_008780 [Nepenthes gracilis]
MLWRIAIPDCGEKSSISMVLKIIASLDYGFSTVSQTAFGTNKVYMASKKKESEAFSLLQSMYNDEDDDMENVDNEEDQEIVEYESQQQQQQPGVAEVDMDTKEQQGLRVNDADLSTSTDAMPQPLQNTDSTPQGENLRPPTPQQSLLVLSSLPQEVVSLDSLRSRRERPTIVDYGHDEVANSPEAEEGEILGTGRTMYDEEVQNANADFQERTPVVNLQTSTPSIQSTPQSSIHADILQSDVVYKIPKESEIAVSESAKMSEEVVKDVDPLDSFLPPPPKAKCSDELQEKINKFLAYKRLGKSFNAEVRNRKDYRNPDFLQHAVRYQEVDEIGSCFSKDVFDPHGYDSSDFYDAIEADMKHEVERKELEKKKNQKMEFVSGGTQLGPAVTVQKVNMPVTGLNPTSGGLQSAPVASEACIRESRQNKKSKWDKVDGDRRSTHGGGQDSVSAVGSHAALLSAANAGAGYSIFAQQKRREAEEKRLSEKKVVESSCLDADFLTMSCYQNTGAGLLLKTLVRVLFYQLVEKGMWKSSKASILNVFTLCCGQPSACDELLLGIPWKAWPVVSLALLCLKLAFVVTVALYRIGCTLTTSDTWKIESATYY